ncbi:hypothetical protein JOF53_007965 [Crossiella equi]|uniref:Uncharacterized protein n=1 Tax=Crossiella equi TaxID=130796 RepID=A0ABS5ARA1_9PSEU|nr:hypothetical protein [Crossiella equi]
MALLVGAVFLLLGRRVRDYVDEAERVIRTGLAELEHRD